ncbi:MAG: hypothetical protein JXX14_08530 [Deltaproteobacteria bacterium]|nr:hypothetical protein [Deltaproteobacteria bacterium]
MSNNYATPTAATTALFGILALLWGCHSTDAFQLDGHVTDEAGCANAIPVVWNDNVFQHDGTVDGLTDAAFFNVPVMSAGSWLLVDTFNDQIVGPTFDPVVSILNATGTQRLAMVDRVALWQSEDPHFHYHLADTQSLCIKIESFSRWTHSYAAAQMPDAPLAYSFQLSLNPDKDTIYEPETDVVAENPFTDSTPLTLSASEDNPDAGYHWLHGVLNTAQDADVYSFTSLNMETITDIFVNGETGIGDPYGGVSGIGTTAQITLQLIDADETIVAELSPDRIKPVLSAVLAPNSRYYIRVTGAPDWMPGQNNFYNLYLASESVQNFDMETASDNNTLDNATKVNLTAGESGSYSGIVIGTLETETDVDVFQIALTPGQMFMLQCLGASSGSGLQNLTVGTFEANGTRVRADIEKNTPIEWSTGPNSTRGPLWADDYEDLYLRISGDYRRSPLSRFYQCYILVMDEAY